MKYIPGIENFIHWSAMVMRTDYRKLWKLLIDHNMTKSELKVRAGISSVTLAKLGKNENVTTDILVRICSVLNCSIGDIVDIMKDSNIDDECLQRK